MRTAGACALGVLLIASSAAAQPVRAFATFETWVEAVEQHSIGTLDPSAHTILELEQAQFEGALPLMVLLVERAQETRGTRVFDDLFRRLRRESDLSLREDAALSAIAARVGGGRLRAFVKRAAMLHTDIVVAERDAHPTTIEGGGYIAADGRSRGEAGRSWHWLLARSFLHLALIDWSDPRRPLLKPDSDPDVRLWYQGIANYLWSLRDFTEGMPHVKRGLDLFPGDAELEFVRGLIHEAQAGPHIQAAVDEQTRLIRRTRRTGYTPAVESAGKERGEANEAFRRALAAQPNHFEARLHLAQTLNTDAAYGEAAQELDVVLANAKSPWHRYFAYLFLGRAEEGRGRLGEARAAYAQASAIFPDAQAPRLALSQLALRAGDRDQGLAVFAFLSRVRNAQSEPWWLYDAVREPEADAVWLQRVFEAFRGPA